MTIERRRQIESLCQQALATDATRRAAFLDEACLDDPELRREVQSMLDVQPDAGAFLETPAWDVPAAPLAPGTRLGPYEIHSLIGAGGMGVVYKARDTRLDRTVAIKVLPPAIATDPARRGRFEAEAKTIAGLSHSHICTLYDVGDQDGSMFLVMEHLGGETLAERLRKGPLPLRQALATAAEIAAALSAAHRQGVVHRNLKPGNVMLTKSGAKLLDFGLAKLRRAGFGPSTRSSGAGEPRTQAGTVLGTVPYMAPEQIEGRDADTRSDIFSFGAVLYEMVAGKRAFEGDSDAGVAAAILEHEPAPISLLQPRTPPMLDWLVRQCLAKSPDDRPDSAHDVAKSLRWIQDTSDAVIPAGTRRRRWSALRASLALAALLGAAIAGAGGMAWLRPGPPRQMTRSALPVDPAEALDGGIISGAIQGSGMTLTPGGSRTAFTWTPDGRFVFVGRQDGVRRLYVRRLEAARAQELPNTEGAHAPAVSPDGRWVAFWADGSIRKVPLAGGQAVSLAATMAPFGFAWTADGRLLFGAGLVHEVSSGDRGSTRVSSLDPAHNRHDLPCLLPGGRTLLYTGKKRVYSWGSDEEILAQNLATGSTKGAAGQGRNRCPVRSKQPKERTPAVPAPRGPVRRRVRSRARGGPGPRSSRAGGDGRAGADRQQH